MSSKTELVFVYGTLMPSLNHAAVRDLLPRLELTARGSVHGRLVVYNKYPAIILNGSPSTTVHGEVVRLLDDEILSALDEYEGIRPGRSGSYFRRRCFARLQTGGVELCWVYALRDELQWNAVPIPSGDYSAWLQDGGESNERSSLD